MKARLNFRPWGWQATAFIATMVMVGCGIQFKELTLADPRAALTFDGFAEFESRAIYRDHTGDEVWGLETDPCKTFGFSKDKTYNGSSAIKLSWNKTTCDWVGMGIGWDGWESKDMSGIMSEAALQFYIRSIEGESTIPIMIFLLEDYSGKMTASAFRAKYLEAYPINEEWKKARIPLNTFPFEQDGVDIRSIKQLVIELQGSGDVIIDELEIVPDAGSSGTRSRGKPSITPLGGLPLTLFHDELRNSWGLEKNECRDFNYASENAQAGSKSLHLKWANADDCTWTPFGFSWNRWLGVDMSQQVNNAKLSFYVKTASGTAASIPLQVGFEDYLGRRTLVELAGKYSATGSYGPEWQAVTIPLADFDFSGRGVAVNNIKQFYITAQQQGDIYLDEIRLIP